MLKVDRFISRNSARPISLRRHSRPLLPTTHSPSPCNLFFIPPLHIASPPLPPPLFSSPPPTLVILSTSLLSFLLFCLFIFLFVFLLISAEDWHFVVFDTRCQHPVPLVVSLDLTWSLPRFIEFRTSSARLNLVQIFNTFRAATGLVCT